MKWFRAQRRPIFNRKSGVKKQGGNGCTRGKLSLRHIRAKKKLWEQVSIKLVSRVMEEGVNHTGLVINKVELLTERNACLVRYS